MDYTRIYNQIIERAQTRKLEGYVEKHHITPKCIGGLDEKENIVELTAREHFLCHMLLCEIYPQENKLKHALFLMAIGKNKRKNTESYKISSKLYEIYRLEFIKTLKGKKLSQTHIDKMSQNRKGIYHSIETKDKISKSLQGRDVTWGDKISEGKKGISRDITWGDKISAAKVGKPKKGKSILQICPKTLEVIQEFSSVSEAINVVGTKGIPNALLGFNKTSGGYIWKYKE
jgi:hypothetical protein